MRTLLLEPFGGMAGDMFLAALLDLDVVREAIVVARENEYGNQQLVAYVVPNHEPGPEGASLRRVLERVTLDALVEGRLPDEVVQLAEEYRVTTDARNPR